MKLIKISPKFQITISSIYRHLCKSGWFSLLGENGIITLRPIEIKEAKTEEEIMEDLLNPNGEWRREGDSNPR